MFLKIRTYKKYLIHYIFSKRYYIMSHSNTRPVGGAVDTDHLYYNITLSDDNSNSYVDNSGNILTYNVQQSSQVFSFTQTRLLPYLSKPDDYNVSVIRFTIDSPNLPILAVQPVVGQNDFNKLIYSIGIRDTSGNIYQTNLGYYAQDQNLSLVPPPPIRPSYINPTLPYYYVYNYEFFLSLINIAFEAIIGENYPLGTPIPYMYFDVNTKLFSLGAELNAYRTKLDGTALGTFEIFFSTELYSLFSSLPAHYVGNTIGDLLDYRMVLYTGSDLASSTQPYVTNVRYNTLSQTNDVYATQDYSTLPIWSPVTGIFFKTSILPTAPENMATPVVYQGGININAFKQNAEILNVLADHYTQLDIGTEYKPYIYYEPTGEYKLTELYGEKQLDAIDISMFWRDNFGNLIPFYLGIGCSATIKIMFRKKTFNSEKE